MPDSDRLPRANAAAATRADWSVAAARLAEAHPLAEELHGRHGPPHDIRRTPPGERFASLARAIAYQQLSGRAAATIWTRVADTVGDPHDPAAVAATPHDDLRAAGLSNAKALAVADLAARALDGTLDLRATSRMTDDEVITHLCRVRGIGPWTAQMFLIFDLGRTDVWPAGDLGVRAGWARATGTEMVARESDFLVLGEPFAPHRTVMAWWCWCEADGGGTW